MVTQNELSTQESGPMSEQLLELARRRGYLTYGDILEAYPQPELNVAEVDQLYAVYK